ITGLKVKLLDHQLDGVGFMNNREKAEADDSGRGGLLCDDMGLGKTIQTMALILSNPLTGSSDGNISKSTLIIAPLALVGQWADELSNKCDNLLVMTYHGSGRTSSLKFLQSHDVVITTYSIIANEFKKNINDSPLLNTYWYRVVLDEAHYIKNKNSQTAKGCFALNALNRWCLTGTPMQNSITELYSYFRFLQIRPFDSYAVFQREIISEFTSHQSNVALSKLKLVLGCIMLRRTKDILKNGKVNLPLRTIHKTILEFSPGEFEVYSTLQSKFGRLAIKSLQLGKSVIHALVFLLRLRQACDHFSLISDIIAEREISPASESLKSHCSNFIGDSHDVSDLEEMLTGLSMNVEKCSICMSVVTAKTQDLALNGKIYCFECRNMLINQSMREPDFESAKIKAILKLIMLEKSRKTIVFSQFTGMLNIIAKHFRSHDISHSIYHGGLDNTKRISILNKFKSDPSVNVLLCSLKCGAYGLNLTAASRVILVDPWWNPMVTEQAIDRVHRIGQTRDVDVYELIIANSVEAKISSLQEQKMQQAKAVLSGSGGNLNSINAEELQSLFG
ncbi:hypothetical protein CANCADRAFT_12534, partial [Tortispora caseinolytica NRRL Y-17796]